MNNKKTLRLRRAKKNRAIIAQSCAYRLCVYKTNKHIYAQLIDPSGKQVLASASTLDKTFASDLLEYSNSNSNDVCSLSNGLKEAKLVGLAIAKRALSVGINKVAFDRSGFKYHGRIKALADSARESGLTF